MKTLTILFALLFSITNCNAQADIESSNISSNTLVSSSFINDQEGWVVDNTGAILHTTDSAKTWNSISSGNYFSKLDFVDLLMGYAISTDAAFKTTDGGSTWTTLSIPGNIGKSIYFLDSENGFVCGKNLIYKTTDGGSTWETITTGASTFLDFFFVNSTTGIAAAAGDSTTIWRTTDGGNTWSGVFGEENNAITSVWFTDEHSGFAAGYYNQIGAAKEPVILRTIDGGETWSIVYLNHDVLGEGEWFTDIRFKNQKDGFAISSFSESAFTTDGGITWSRTYENKDFDFPKFAGIFLTLAGNSKIYITGEDGYVVKWK